MPDAPELPKGAMVCGNPPGDALDVMGEIQDSKGEPIINALIDVWQAGEDGLYSSQDPNKAKFELRGRFRSDLISPSNYVASRGSFAPGPTSWAFC